LHTVDGVDDEAARRLEALVVRRERDAEPVSHLLGSRAFYDLDVDVDRRVLTPRPETETLIEVFAELAEAGALPPGPVADWGTGSGVLAAVLRRWRPVLALERSADARELAARNLGRGDPGRGWMLVASDGLGPVARGSLAAVVANPPYIEPPDWDDLPEDVRRHEPRQALLPDDGDVVGLYAWIGAEAARCLVPGGHLLAEVGAGQAQRLEQALGSGGLVPRERRRDLLGHERVLVLRRP
jgi:release factor glutamine methyltransferase